jgi:hypothetical protein
MTLQLIENKQVTITDAQHRTLTANWIFGIGPEGGVSC